MDNLLVQNRIDKRIRLANTFKRTIFGVSAFNIVIIFLIFFFIVKNGLQFFIDGESVIQEIKHFFIGYTDNDPNFDTGFRWIPLSEFYNIIPLAVGTLWVSLIAICIAVPLSIITSVFIREYAPEKIRGILKVIIEMMSALPSIVLGYFGLTVLAPLLAKVFNIGSGLNALNGGFILALMALPTIVGMTDEALVSLDKSYKEASLALGASRVETIFKVLLPSASSAIVASIILGFGRIIGETMVVLLVTGHSPIMQTNPLGAVRTLTATIAAEMGEVIPGEKHYFALFALGLLLFLVNFLLNNLAHRYVMKSKKMFKN